MSTKSAQDQVNRIGEKITSKKKKIVQHQQSKSSNNTKIIRLQERLARTKSEATRKSIIRQIQSIEKKNGNISNKIVALNKDIDTLQKRLSNASESLRKATERELKKQQKIELDFLNKKQQANRNELTHYQSVTAEIKKQQVLFGTYKIDNTQAFQDKEDFSISEIVDLSQRIDDVLAHIEKLGMGQEVIFNEIDSLKEKSRKISKKDFNLLLIGQLVSFGSGLLTQEQLASIFQQITQMNLTKLIGE